MNVAVAGPVCSQYGKSVVKQWIINSATTGTHLICNVEWILLTLLGHSGTQGAGSILLTLSNAGIKASAICKAVTLESWVEMTAQSFCYLRNHSMDYCTEKWFKEVEDIPDPDCSK